MTPAQRNTVNLLVEDGFRVVLVTDVVRLTKGADKRLVRTDGSQKRANHYYCGGQWCCP